MPTTILLADDHVLVRESLKALLHALEWTVVAEASDGAEAVKLAEALHPHIAVMDVSMPAINGISAAAMIGKSSPGTKCILLTMHGEDEYVRQAAQAGVVGYVLKTRTADDLIEAIRAVERGARYLSPGISREAFQSVTQARISNNELTVRERQVLQLIAGGSSNKEIAGHLEITSRTVESHRAKIMEKLDIHEVAGLVRYAVRHKIFQP
jgi:two-component system response regulator NreC